MPGKALLDIRLAVSSRMGTSQQLGLSFALPTRKIYAVRELVSTLRTELERSFTDIYVEGEISNYRPAESGTSTSH